MPFQDVIRKEHSVFELGHLRKPLVEFRMKFLLGSLVQYDSLGLKNDLRLTPVYKLVLVRRIVGFLLCNDLNLLSSCRCQHFPRWKQLHCVHCVAGEEDFTFHLLSYVVQQVIACIVQDHADRAQRNATRPELESHRNQWAPFVEVLEWR